MHVMKIVVAYCPCASIMKGLKASTNNISNTFNQEGSSSILSNFLITISASKSRNGEEKA
jgi:hypothetical protein